MISGWRFWLVGALLAMSVVPAMSRPRLAKHHDAQSGWVYSTSRSNYRSVKDAAFDDSRVLRGVWLVSDTVGQAGVNAFPAELKTGPGAFSVRVKLEFSVTADDLVTNCEAKDISKRFNSKPTLIMSSSAIAAAACKMAQTRLNFRHGLLQDGSKFGRKVSMAIYFERWSEAEPLLALPPMPYPPTWPPIWPPVQLPLDVVSLDIPQWVAFLPRASTVISPLSTGVWIDIDKDGKVSRCSVAQTSGNAAFDSGVCAAFAASSHNGNSGRSIAYYPVRVHWDGKNASIAPLSWPVAPELVGPSELPQGLAPTGALPGNAKVGLKLSIDQDGRVIRCEVLASAMHDDLDRFSCDAIGRALKFKPASDLFGDPERGALTYEVDWRARSLKRQDYN